MRTRLAARLVLTVGGMLLVGYAHGEDAFHVRLHEGWRIQSSAEVSAGGEAVSTAGFDDKGWHGASVPTTVVGALVDAGVYSDPYFGANFRKLPGTVSKIGENLSLHPLPAGSPFRASWWYRTEFEVPGSAQARAFWLRFDGINYRANIWLNGKAVAGSDDVAGAFRRYEFDVTRFVRKGAKNALAVEVFAPNPDDLAITWVDWNPMPPDKNMGLWQAVSLAGSGPVALRHPYVATRFDLPSLDVAHLTVEAEVRNATDEAVTTMVRGDIAGIEFSQSVSLAPRESRTVTFAPGAYPVLNLEHPRVWWPYRMGTPELYDLALEAEVGGEISDRQTSRFGVRQIDSELTKEGHRLFKVNGRPILIRGGGWAPDMMLRPSADRLDAELRYVKEMGLNTIRLEGKLEPEEFFDRADSEGILVMAGWCCCDYWEQWNGRIGDYQPPVAKWNAATRKVAVESLEDQVLRLREHPSVFVWLNGSDNPPPADVERAYLDVLSKCRWLNPSLPSATAKPAASGPSGVKMTGPYDYVPPAYWLLDKMHGGAFGFNTETSPGAAVPPIESLRTMLPAEHLWPIDDVWLDHTGGGVFRQLDRFTAALEGRYGKATSVEDYARKSQALAYEGERAMFEAFGRNKYTATGVIQWMLNDAWPSMIWHLYDYYLRPGGGYFGTKKACEPVHVQYSYDDRSVAVVNDLPQGFEGVKVVARVYDLGLKERFSREATLTLPADGVVRAVTIPEIPDLTPTYFLDLVAENSSGATLSRNFYWLSTSPDELDWKKSEWFYTPVTRHSDLAALQSLAPAALKLSASFEDRGADGVARVRVTNASEHLAFQVRLRLTDGEGGAEILPVFWEDNYVSLLPGESREIAVSYRLKDRRAGRPVVSAEGWNVPLTRASEP
jgi:exo-1,4-beta-D-glucosaminidase